MAISRRVFTSLGQHFKRFFEKSKILDFFALWTKNFRHGSHNCIICVQRTFWGEKKFKTIYKIINLFELWVKTFELRQRNFRYSCQNCILSIQSNAFCEILTEKNLNFMAIWRKKNNFVKTAFYVSRGKFWGPKKLSNVSMFSPNWKIKEKKVCILM